MEEIDLIHRQSQRQSQSPSNSKPFLSGRKGNDYNDNKENFKIISPINEIDWKYRVDGHWKESTSMNNSKIINEISKIQDQI